ncbi:MAG: cytochrome C oxidase subunit I [Xanthobacteraceae bacterium]|nr:MAG: cytochrome C oxidase subunit I [Xanthobacteraceae bacterium]
MNIKFNRGRGMQQHTILLVTIIIMACVALPFLFAASAAKDKGPQVGWLGYGAQRSLVAAMLVVGVAVTGISLAVWPHSVSAGPARQVVNVTGHQWYWEIEDVRLVTGSPVVFNVHTEDVNHGLGVYDADFRLIVQIQAMPGYLNQVQYTFEKPGKYRILCMEFCGVAHHDMTSEFTVSAAKS